MSKLTKMIGPDKESIEMISSDVVKKSEHQGELSPAKKTVKVRPKHSMQMAKVCLTANEEIEISQDDLDTIKAKHPHSHEELFYK